MNTLRLVLTKLEDSGMKIKMKKCKLFQKSISYLCFIIDAEGLYPSLDELAAVEDMRIPEKKIEPKISFRFYK